jgi:TonB family protein
MFGALLLLLIALAAVLYADRDFWFPDDQAADEESAQSLPTQTSSTSGNASSVALRRSHPQTSHASRSTAFDQSEAMASALPPITVSERTVLPPLEVEVVAGDAHRTVRPDNNSLRITVQPSEGSQERAGEETASLVTSTAAERVEISAGNTAMVNQPVKPAYPVLARQMKVQGSVILQALIGRDGLIQDLRVVSGPPILANAAQEAVKQWHFKPHYRGSEAVETQAKITVNFTISTN